MARNSVDKRARILVVEDIDTTRKAYVRNLKLEDGYRVDTAGDLAEATAAIDACTYHAALVDIMLAGEKDVANRDGVAVIQRLAALNEGTQAVVLSAQPEKQLIREFLKEYGAFDYLDKERLNDTGMDLMIEFVSNAIEASPVGNAPSWEAVVTALAGDRAEHEFVSQIMSGLSFGGGFENLTRSLGSTVRHLLPLLPPQARNTGLVLDHERAGFVAQYWSKGQGCAIEIGVFGKTGTRTERPGTLDDAVLIRHEKAGLHVVVTRLPRASRDEYAYPHA